MKTNEQDDFLKNLYEMKAKMRSVTAGEMKEFGVLVEAALQEMYSMIQKIQQIQKAYSNMFGYLSDVVLIKAQQEELKQIFRSFLK
jgi:hypothetical protein